jgi:hypothetical protein
VGAFGKKFGKKGGFVKAGAAGYNKKVSKTFCNNDCSLQRDVVVFKSSGRSPRLAQVRDSNSEKPVLMGQLVERPVDSERRALSPKEQELLDSRREPKEERKVMDQLLL